MAREPEEWGGEARLPTWVREIARTARFTRQQPGARARGAHRRGSKVNPDRARPVEVLGSAPQPTCAASGAPTTGRFLMSSTEQSQGESQRKTRVLIVANRTASTPRLIEAVRSRAKAGPCEFALLIPDVTDRKAADWTLETAQRLLRAAARGSVEGLVGGPEPFESVQEAVREGNFDEIIISTLPKKVSKWLRRDLIHRVEGLGLPVTAIVPKSANLSSEEKVLLAGAAAGSVNYGQGAPRRPEGSGP
jgi:hypothetical protein